MYVQWLNTADIKEDMLADLSENKNTSMEKYSIASESPGVLL